MTDRRPEIRGGDNGSPATPPATSPDLAAAPAAGKPANQVAEALRLLRTRRGLTQAAASQLEGAPNVRTVCHWETGRKIPSLKFLIPYLGSLGLDLVDLQDALDEVRAPYPAGCRAGLDELEQRVAEMERRLSRVERPENRPTAAGPRFVRAVPAQAGPAR